MYTIFHDLAKLTCKTLHLIHSNKTLPSEVHISSLNRHSDVSRILHVNFQKKLTYCRITALLILLFFLTCHTSVCLFFSKIDF